MKKKFDLNKVLSNFKCSLIGRNRDIDSLFLCNRESVYKSLLTYVTSKDYYSFIAMNNKIKALITTENIYNELSSSLKKLDLSVVVCDYPEELFYSIHSFLLVKTNFYNFYEYPFKIGANSKIHATSIIEDGVIIGNQVEIGPYSVIKKGTKIGDRTRIGIGTVIGSSGFQILKDSKGISYNVVHVGGVEIGHDTWIGDNVTISNSLFEENVFIGDYCMIDSHCHIGHNCKIGNNSSLAAGVVMFGSSVVNNNCWLSPGVMVMNRVEIADNSKICPNSFIANNTKEGFQYIGNPAIEMNEYYKREKEMLKLTIKKNG